MVGAVGERGRLEQKSWTDLVVDRPCLRCRLATCLKRSRRRPVFSPSSRRGVDGMGSVLSPNLCTMGLGHVGLGSGLC